MSRREDNKLEKRRRLTAEGLRLFLDQGYDRTSVEQIAMAAGVARGTFYLYHPDKLSLFEALVDRWFQPLLGVLESTLGSLAHATTREESLAIHQRMAGELALVAMRHPDEILLTFRENRHAGEAGERLRAREEQVVAMATRLTSLASERGLIDVGEPRLAALVVLGSVERLYYEFLRGSDIGSPDLVAIEVFALFTKLLGMRGD